MKNLFILGSLICLLSACSKYQIHTLNSLKTPKDAQTGDFVVKNDTLEIVYKFGGENGPLEVQIKNKLDEPLYVNWKKSALIIGDKAISYSGNTIALKADYTGTAEDAIFFSDFRLESGKITGTATLPEYVSFIPPKAKITRRLLNVTAKSINLAKDSLKRMRIFQPDGSFYTVKAANFSRENSPLIFKSYITLYTEKANDLKILPYEEEFFISQSVQTGKKPKNTEFYKGNRSDIFYNFEPTGYGKTIAVVGGVAILGALAATADEPTAEDTK